ncbi:NAD(P)H-dependent oxidoreductase [Streptomyces sp. VRA16 Mangrove soil]|uniref:NAD(P)H-dependent oxidoreductase n=1 Tax=Streptomyces sp. VRA16 Mangrove soil TaxID=2817434 RepID=UPI001A9D8ADE|nr:NAD(P)H-dependent oxidoreductase [Streptomyces sp. VRA16 Mangrove soil]MBO1336617.1 NAD(P)H-dependent oxidoreductase [Streptomyces sp. VRA16 Mangrove soil]
MTVPVERVEGVNVSVVYFSATGTVHTLAEAVAEGAQKAGARVRLCRVTEEEGGASAGDVEWGDAVVFGTPARFGNPAAPLRAFIESLGPLGFRGALADKVYSAFTASNSAHGGQESTLLALANTFYHWGGIIVPPGYTDPIQLKSGNPYGASHVSGEGAPGEVSLEAARYLGRRAVSVASAFKAGRAVLGGAG